jgi:uncharacterized protein YjbJ (UPF0337 family)
MSGTVKNTVGKMEETIGNLTGLDSWKTSGKKNQAEGDVEHKQSQAQGYTEGTKDRVVGAAENMAGSLTGDSSQEISGGYFGLSHPLNPAGN